jgi:hypothetical protein
METIISIHKNFKVDLEWLLVNSTRVNNLEDTYILKIGGKEGDFLTYLESY